MECYLYKALLRETNGLIRPYKTLISGGVHGPGGRLTSHHDQIKITDLFLGGWMGLTNVESLACFTNL